MLIITKHHCCPNLRGSDVNGVFAWGFCVTNKIPAENENSGFRTEIFLFYKMCIRDRIRIVLRIYAYIFRPRPRLSSTRPLRCVCVM